MTDQIGHKCYLSPIVKAQELKAGSELLQAVTDRLMADRTAISCYGQNHGNHEDGEAMTQKPAFPRLAILVASSFAGSLLYWLTSSPIRLLPPIVALAPPLGSESPIYCVRSVSAGISLYGRRCAG